MTYYTGLDVSLRSVSVCIIDGTGSVCHETKVAAVAAAVMFVDIGILAWRKHQIKNSRLPEPPAEYFEQPE